MIRQCSSWTGTDATGRVGAPVRAYRTGWTTDRGTQALTVVGMPTTDTFILFVAEYFLVGFAFVLGAIIASFLCVVVERVPRKKSINGRSQCICGRQLSAWENIPIVSWTLLGGRSRCCKSRIPAFYVLAEIGLGSAWALSVLLLPGVLALAGIALSTALMVFIGLKRTQRELAGVDA